jgi:lipid II:glycine glycyltransferase (peptidoglycan interpeptide bridge formation enzyme)
MFCSFFDAFASVKGIGLANRRKLELLAQAESLVLSFSIVTEKADQWYSAHAYICDGTRARLLYSAGNVTLEDSEERKVQGRANKLLHWNMIEHFKAQHFAEYDLGGISKSEVLRAVDDFKLGFGGREVVEYNCLVGITLVGKVTALVFFLFERWKRIRPLRLIRNSHGN